MDFTNTPILELDSIRTRLKKNLEELKSKEIRIKLEKEILQQYISEIDEILPTKKQPEQVLNKTDNQILTALQRQPQHKKGLLVTEILHVVKRLYGKDAASRGGISSRIDYLEAIGKIQQTNKPQTSFTRWKVCTEEDLT